MALSNIYQKASLVQIPSGYNGSTAKLYSVLPANGDGDFTVSADADATRIDENGFIETTVLNQARLSRNFIDGVVQPDPFLLLEPTSANLLQRSEDYANPYWLRARVGSSATGFTAPDGSSNATYFEQESGQTTAAVIYKSAFTSASSGIYTFSIWAKKADKRYLKFQTRVNSATYITVFDLQDGIITYDSGNENAKIEEYPNGWFRLSVQRTSTTTDDIIVYYYLNDSGDFSDTVTDSGGVYIWGSQVEKNDYLTSYIPTTSAAVTRTEDYCYINSGLQNTLNTSEGTLFVDVEVPRVSTTGSFERIVLSDQTSATDRIIFDNYGGNWRALMLSGANNVNKTIASVTANQRIKVAIAYSSTQLRISYDGNAATTTSGTYAPTTTLESFKFSNKDGGNKWQGKIYQAMYFNTALSNIELIALTSN